MTNKELRMPEDVNRDNIQQIFICDDGLFKALDPSRSRSTEDDVGDVSRIPEVKGIGATVRPSEGKQLSSAAAMPSLPLLATALLVVLSGGFHFGFQVAITNPLSEILQNFTAEVLESRYDYRLSELTSRLFVSFIASVLLIGAVVGCAIVPPINAALGSRYSLIITTSVMLVSLTMASLSKHFRSPELLVVSRFVIGVCVGMGTTVQGVFLTEISPLHCRGLIGTMAGLSTNIGFLIASSVGLPTVFGTAAQWPLTFGVATLPCVVFLLAATFWIRESAPFFLRNSDEKGARRALTRYHRCSAHDTDNILEGIRADLQISTKNPSWTLIFKDRPTRRALSFAVVLNVAVSFSGIMAVSFFGTFLLTEIGFSHSDAALANCLSALAGTAGALLSSLCVDRVGRRFLIVGSLCSLALANTGMMLLVWTFLTYHFLWLGYLFLLLIGATLFVFSMGIGPMAWFLSTELADTCTAPRVQSLSISSQHVTSFLSPMIFFPLQKFVGPFSFLLFVVPLTFSAVYMYCFLPETRTRSARQIRALLDTDQPFWKHNTVHQAKRGEQLDGVSS